MNIKRAFSFVFVAAVLVACSAARPGGILVEKGPCGGDALESQCSWGGCCPKDYDCTPHGCEHEPVGPAFLGPSTPQ